MKRKIVLFSEREITKEKMAEIFQGWNAYAKWANTFDLRLRILEELSKVL